jgi:glycosyltransferase involved in cell wall biosynthesis
MKIPRVSIGLPVYNGEKYIQHALDSLLQQDYEDFELIISDNASTDLSPEICKRYAAMDKRIRYYQNESNIGAKWNYRRVFELAKGKYFKWAACDDECYPSMVRRCAETLDETPASVVLVYPKGEIIDEYGRVVGTPEDHVNSNAAKPHRRLTRVLFRVALAHSFYGLIRSEALRKTRGYVNIAADWVILAELAMLGEIWEIPEVLFRLRRHPECAMELHKTRRAMEEWHDPNRKNLRVVLPFDIAVIIEYLRSVRYARLRPLDKGLCFVTALVVPPWRGFLRATGKPRNRLRSVLKLMK